MSPASRRLALLLLLMLPPAAQADSLRLCDRAPALDARERDQMLRVAAIVKTELERSGSSVALLSRSGLDLDRLGVRYSHAGISVRSSANGPWSVRQLYYACDEGRPRIFDQGVAGFVMGISAPEQAYLSAVTLPAAAAAELERATLDNASALQLLGDRYSANAHAFGLLYQNCNQWVAELLALTWGRPTGDAPPRARAQRWLQQQGYEPTPVAAGPLLMLAGLFVPFVHQGDHPEADLQRGIYRISLPQSIEHFVQQQVPGAARVEFCHDGRRVVVHRGWTPIAAGCAPAAGDEVVALD